MPQRFTARLLRALPPRAAGAVLLVEAEGRRLLLWPGEGPDARPAHPALPDLAGRGEVEGQAVWAEELPAGELLDALRPGSPGVAAALADVAQALSLLHGTGRAHGGLDATCVLVCPGGGLLLGAAGEGEPAEDRAALRALEARWLDDAGEEVADGADAVEAPPAGARVVELILRAPGEPTAPLDEVSFEIGLDEPGRGLLDTWAGRTAPGEEPTGAIGVAPGSTVELTALLARLAAGIGRDAPPDRYAAAEGIPSRAVKALLADEPLDPLPVPEGLPLPGTGFLDPAGSTEVTAVAERPTLSGEERERPTATGEEPERTGRAPEPEISASLLIAAVALALAAGALGTWLLLGGGLP